MAHGGDELVLHLLDALALGDIADHRDEAHLALVADLRDRQLQGEALAALAQALELAGLVDHPRFAGVQVVQEIAIVRAAVGFGHQDADVVPGDVGLGVAEHLLGRVVEGLDRARAVDGDDGIDDIVEQGAQVVLALADGPFGADPRAEVLDLRDEVHRLALRIADQGHAEQAPEHAALLVHVALFHLVGADPPGDQVLEVVQVGIQVVGVGEVHEIAVQQLFAAVAEHAAQFVVDLQPAAIRGDQGHAQGRRVEGIAEALLA